MKKHIVLIIIIVLILVVGISAAVYINSENRKQPKENNAVNLNSNNESIENIATNVTENKEEATNMNEETRIKLTVNNEEIYVKLDNNKSSKQFLEMLPLTLNFEDYNNTEKIATLPEKLSTEDAPSGYDPQIGDFSYYAPWGNLSIFYKDFRYSNSLVKLGTFESGIEKLENINEDFTVKIEKVD